MHTILCRVARPTSQQLHAHPHILNSYRLPLFTINQRSRLQIWLSLKHHWTKSNLFIWMVLLCCPKEYFMATSIMMGEIWEKLNVNTHGHQQVDSWYSTVKLQHDNIANNKLYCAKIKQHSKQMVSVLTLEDKNNTSGVPPIKKSFQKKTYTFACMQCIVSLH